MNGKKICPDCNRSEGELHKLGCDMEKCPFCGHQLISCECFKDVTDDELTEIFKDIDRIPYIDIPILCSLCGKTDPDTFMVKNWKWKKYIIPELQSKTLCKRCYNRMKIMFPNGWRIK